MSRVDVLAVLDAACAYVNSEQIPLREAHAAVAELVAAADVLRGVAL